MSATTNEMHLTLSAESIAQLEKEIQVANSKAHGEQKAMESQILGAILAHAKDTDKAMKMPHIHIHIHWDLGKVKVNAATESK